MTDREVALMHAMTFAPRDGCAADEVVDIAEMFVAFLRGDDIDDEPAA